MSKPLTKKQKFIEFVEDALFSKLDVNEIDPDVLLYWEAMREKGDKEKPMFTENGKLVLKYMQEHPEEELLKAKDIAEGLFISSRTVSGAMRKLVTDGYVEKVATDPVIYSITEQGKTVEIN